MLSCTLVQPTNWAYLNAVQKMCAFQHISTANESGVCSQAGQTLTVCMCLAAPAALSSGAAVCMHPTRVCTLAAASTSCFDALFR